MTAAVLLVLAVAFAAASIEFLVEAWREPMDTLQGPAGEQ